jgi:predicted transposase YdaD
VIEQDKITPEERARMKEEDNQVEAKTQAFKEGEEKGWKKGKDEGRKEGKDDGIKETARKFKANGKLTEEEIASITGLTLEVVKAL